MKIEDELIETPDGAFLSAIVPNRLEQIELQPFSAMRQSVALSLGVSDKPDDGFFDAIIMIWLCTLDEDQVLAAKRNKQQALKDAFHWADSCGYSIANFEPILKIYQKIGAEIRKSADAVLSGNGTTEKNSGGQPAS